MSMPCMMPCLGRTIIFDFNFVFFCPTTTATGAVVAGLATEGARHSGFQLLPIYELYTARCSERAYQIPMILYTTNPQGPKV